MQMQSDPRYTFCTQFISEGGHCTPQPLACDVTLRNFTSRKVSVHSSFMSCKILALENFYLNSQHSYSSTQLLQIVIHTQNNLSHFEITGENNLTIRIENVVFIVSSLYSSSVIDDKPLRFRNEVYHPYHFNCTACGVELNSDAREVKSRPGLTANEMVSILEKMKSLKQCFQHEMCVCRMNSIVFDATIKWVSQSVELVVDRLKNVQ